MLVQKIARMVGRPNLGSRCNLQNHLQLHQSSSHYKIHSCIYSKYSSQYYYLMGNISNKFPCNRKNDWQKRAKKRVIVPSNNGIIKRKIQTSITSIVVFKISIIHPTTIIISACTISYIKTTTIFCS